MTIYSNEANARKQATAPEGVRCLHEIHYLEGGILAVVYWVREPDQRELTFNTALGNFLHFKACRQELVKYQFVDCR